GAGAKTHFQKSKSPPGWGSSDGRSACRADEAFVGRGRRPLGDELFFLVARGRALGWRYIHLNGAFHPPPRAIRVKAHHFNADIGGAQAEVLLVDDPLMIDEERHQAGTAVSRGTGHEREAADHVAAHHIVDFAAWGVRPLPGENLIVIALIGSP